MRTIILIVLTVVVLVGGFSLYQWQQGPLAYQAGKKPVIQSAASPGDDVRVGSLGSGKDVWAVKSDRDTGLPILRFRAKDYQPQVDGRVKVDHPQALFFLGADRSRIVCIEGNTGWVALHGEGPRVRHDLTAAAPMETPTRGDLLEVKVRYFLSQAAMDANDPEATLELHHVSFDVETYRIASEAFTDEQGRRVEADEVPIHVIGKDFDFDGRGLQLRWDEFDQRLQSLRVAKGERLTIKHPRDFRFPGAQGAEARAVGSRAVGEPIAAAGKQGVAPAVRAARQKPSDVYRATFHDGVKVTQSNQQLAQGAAMNLDFLSAEPKEAKASATQASTSPSRAGAGAGAATEPGAAGSSVAGASPTSSPSPSPAADVKENAPIIVTWTGEFTVNVAPPAAIFPRTRDDAVIELVGPDAVITADGNRLEADRALYHVGPKVAYARGSEKLPVKFTDARGSTIISESLEYSLGTPAKKMPAWAMLSGKSSAVIPTDIEGKAETMRASWSKVCTLHFAPGDGKGSGQIEMVEMTGAVSIEHPQIRRFKAEKLVLQFDPKMAPKGADPRTLAGQTIRKIAAEGDVDALLADTEGKTSAIQCQVMKLDTAIASNGKLYPTRIEAHGKVVAGDLAEQAGELRQEIRAENLVASLVPGGVAGGGDKIDIGGLKDLAADGDVSVTSSDGGKLEAEKLTIIDVKEGQPKLVRIEGKEGGMATVSQKGRGNLTGHVIELNLPDEYAHVIGAGSMRLAEAGTPAHAAMPMQVAWTKEAVVDGKGNRAVIDGKVAVTYLASDGSTNNAWGERADIRMETRKVVSPKPKKQGRISFLGDRFCEHLELTSASAAEDVQVQSVLPAEDGTLIRQMNVLGPKLICEFAEEARAGTQVVVLQGMTVPAGKDRPGRMLYVDLPQTARRVVATKPGLESKGLHGATAFSWKDKMVYERPNGTLSMLGDVVIRHEPKDRGAEAFDVTAQRVTAYMAEQRDVGGRSPAASKSNPDMVMPTMALKRMVAEGTPLRFVRQDLEFTAPLVEFNPITSLAIAHSTDRMPVHVDKGMSRGDFREVQVNTETQMVKLLDAGMTGRK